MRVEAGDDQPRPGNAEAGAQVAGDDAPGLGDEIGRQMRGQPLRDWTYQDFGSLVSLGSYSTVGNLMGGFLGGNLFIEGLFARLMYKSLYSMHQLALHGPVKVTLDTIARLITQRTEPRVKLH